MSEGGDDARTLTERIAHDQHFAELYMPFDGLVFFSEAGNGDQFAMSLSGNQEVFLWDHENDSRTWVAPTICVSLRIG